MVDEPKLDQFIGMALTLQGAIDNAVEQALRPHWIGKRIRFEIINTTAEATFPGGTRYFVTIKVLDVSKRRDQKTG